MDEQFEDLAEELSDAEEREFDVGATIYRMSTGEVTKAGEARRKAEAQAPPKTLLEQLSKKSSIQLFLDRLKREGKHAEYKARIRVLIEGGLHSSKAAVKARVEYGYKGREERDILNREIATVRMTTVQEVISKGQRAHKARRKTKSFESLLTELPATGPIDADMAWVQSHPAMSRYERQVIADGGSPQPVLVSNEDIHEVNGTAPSRRAVLMLQNWVNRAPEFYKSIIGEHRKHTTSGTGSNNGQEDAVKDDGLADLDRMLTQMGGKDANNPLV